MKKYLLLSSLLLPGLLLAFQAKSQDHSGNEKEEIIIRKRGDFPKDVTIQLKGDQVTINGKKPEDVEGNIEVIRRKSSGSGDEEMNSFGDASPFGNMPHGFNFSQAGPASNGNRALLGVLTMPDDSSEGARIEEVEKGTPADSAGLQKGDVITKINDTEIHSAEELTKAVGKYDPGDQVKVTYLRNKRTYSADVRLGKNDNNSLHYFGMGRMHDNRFPFQGPPPMGGQNGMQNFMQQFRRAHPFMGGGAVIRNKAPRLGMTVENNSEGNGITVKSVQSGSAAAKSGFKAGDIISKFGGKEITDIDDIQEAIGSHQDDKTVKATVIRNGKTHLLNVQMPEHHEQADL